MSYHRDVMKRVAVYIGVMMVSWQDVADNMRNTTSGKSNFNLLLQYILASIHS
jgi:hypothetical protein